ncbi:protein glucosyltransferase [Apostasia shenzhenica]|uniref:Protein glucosyltransferase n=1 Tax=Apostasia shenzhenica TaxID=1088818 RepID=A0A2I0ATF0_9ASPA|nr:protein glucosyltransferase [Apostasia shenzhenica]
MEGNLHGSISSPAKRAFPAITSLPKAVVSLFAFLFVGALVFSSLQWISEPSSFLNKIVSNGPNQIRASNKTGPITKHGPTINITCPSVSPGIKLTCPSTSSPSPSLPTSPSPPPFCPDYFRWIREDLRPWAAGGISRETLERAAADAAFRLVVVGGRAYVHHYHPVFQTRDLFTIWGFLQLFRRYPGRVPDLDLMFNCEDMPVVRPPAGDSPSQPPRPLFRYCKDDTTVDIVFPDWSFWGWPEVNVRPWETMSAELRRANVRLPWREREPYAYWKGNPYVAQTRNDLMKCNVSEKEDWGLRLFTVDWGREGSHGFKTSNLASQCTYRYKVYIEGRSWSVSEKYIMGCDSLALYVQSKFQDFVSRGLRPGRHYWPIPQKDKCRAIKRAVEWAEAHPNKAHAMGKEGSSFIHEKLQMSYVYDYMLHLLTEYSKLLTYKPTVPPDAVELCLETVACPAPDGKVREYLMESVEAAGPSDSEPCTMPPPFENDELKQLVMEKTADGTGEVVESLVAAGASARGWASRSVVLRGGLILLCSFFLFF